MPMTDTLLRSESFDLDRQKLRRGVAPLRNGELGGIRLSNNSGLRLLPKETLFFFICGDGRSAGSSPLLRFFDATFSKRTKQQNKPWLIIYTMIFTFKLKNTYPFQDFPSFSAMPLYDLLSPLAWRMWLLCFFSWLIWRFERQLVQ